MCAAPAMSVYINVHLPPKPPYFGVSGLKIFSGRSLFLGYFSGHALVEILSFLRNFLYELYALFWGVFGGCALMEILSFERIFSMNFVFSVFWTDFLYEFCLLGVI
jgi:hypothetical protein